MLSILNWYNVPKVGDLENKATSEVAGLVFSLLLSEYLNYSPQPHTKENLVRVYSPYYCR